MSFALAGGRLPIVKPQKGPVSSERRRAGVSSPLWNKGSFSGKACKLKCRNASSDTDSVSTSASASSKLPVPGTQSDYSSLTKKINCNQEVGCDTQVFNEENVFNQDNGTIDSLMTAKSLEPSSQLNEHEITKQSSVHMVDKSNNAMEEKRCIPLPGSGQRIYEIDSYLQNHRAHLDYRFNQYKKMRELIDKREGGLDAFSRGYEIFGFNRSKTGVTYREWAPGATSASLIGDFNNWNPKANVMTKNEFGVWELFVPNNADGSSPIPHGSRVKWIAI